MKKNLRKRYLLDPRFQLKYAALFFVVGLVVAAGVGTVAFFSLKETYQSFLNANFYQPPELVQSLENQLRGLAQIMGALLFLLALCCLAMGVYLTHRVVGPLYRMRATMDRIRKGETKVRLKFREGDEFQDLATTFNEMIDQLTRKS